MQRLADLDWVALDTEATGFSNVTDRLVEVAGVRFRREAGRWRDAGEFAELVRPGVPIPAEVTGIHGLTDADVAQAPPPHQALPRLFAFAKGAVLVAHYAPFDVGALAYTCLRERIPVPALVALDTYTLSRRLVPDLPDYSLETVTRALGVPQVAHHRALPDARATRDLFQRCVARVGDPDLLIVGLLLEQTGPPLELERVAELAREMPENWRELQSAIESGQDLQFRYRGGSHGAAPRRVTPSHLFARDGRVYLDGVCHTDGKLKGFRLDRIEELQTLARPAPTTS
jgi:DNA polymerase-3 subunit epsilon